MQLRPSNTLSSYVESCRIMEGNFNFLVNYKNGINLIDNKSIWHIVFQRTYEYATDRERNQAL